MEIYYIYSYNYANDVICCASRCFIRQEFGKCWLVVFGGEDEMVDALLFIGMGVLSLTDTRRWWVGTCGDVPTWLMMMMMEKRNGALSMCHCW